MASTRKEKELGRLSRAWTEKLHDRDFADKHGYDAAAERLGKEADEAGRKYRQAR